MSEGQCQSPLADHAATAAAAWTAFTFRADCSHLSQLEVTTPSWCLEINTLQPRPARIPFIAYRSQTCPFSQPLIVHVSPCLASASHLAYTASPLCDIALSAQLHHRPRSSSPLVSLWLLPTCLLVLPVSLRADKRKWSQPHPTWTLC